MVVYPLSVFAGVYAVNSSTLPIVTVASGSSSNPFAAAPNFGAVSPFNAQVNNCSTYAVDAISIDFQ